MFWTLKPINMRDTIEIARNSWFTFVLAVIVYILLSVLVIGANPFAGETSAPMDLLSRYPGWSSHVFLSTFTHNERSDILDVFIPQWITLKKAIRNCKYGIWNPVSMNPGVIDVSRAAFTPSFLAFLLIDEHWLGFYCAGLLKMIIAAVGTFLFLRLFVSFFSALWGGIIFAYSGFNAAWFYWPQVSTSSWIPWILWACSGWYLFKDKKWILYIIFSTVMLILGGFPAVAAYGLYSSTLLMALFSFYEKLRLKNAIYLAGVMFASFGVAFLISSIPLLALSDALNLIDLGYRRGGSILNFPKDLVLFVNPHLYSSPLVEKTMYVGIIAFALSLISSFLFFKKNVSWKLRFLLIFGLSLLFCSIVIAFGIIPHEAIRLIPAVGNNPWSRLIVIVDLAIAILAVVVLDYLISRTWLLKNKALKIICIVVLLAGVGYQVYDQIVLFREFNNISVRQDFFPSTPVTEYVSKKLTGVQSVVADNSFLVSGTLGAYGIPEWFAHGFKTNYEMNVLGQIVSNPFRTFTAASFSASDIRFESNRFSKLGIRYILINSADGKLVRCQSHGQHVAAPPMPINSLTQIVNIKEPIFVSAVGIVLATYKEKHAPSDVFLEIITSGGEVLARALLKADTVRDNENAVFKFAKSIKLLPGRYELNLGLIDSESNGQLTAWYTKNVKHQGDLIRINGEDSQGAMLYSFYGESILPLEQKRWRIHDDIDNKIIVVENLATPKGAYFVKSLDPDSEWKETNVNTERISAERVKVKYLSHEAGYIVLPIRWFSGWVAYLNGKKKTPQGYLGMLLSVKVDGPSTIEFSYEPKYLGVGLILTILGIFGSLLLYIAGSKKCLFHWGGTG